MAISKHKSVSGVRAYKEQSMEMRIETANLVAPNKLISNTQKVMK